MAIIRPLRGFTPKIGENTFIAENAVIIGDCTIGENSSIWYGAVLRGDVNSIIIGDRTNVQDGSVLHTLYGRSVTKLGNDVSVGHNAVIHGAEVKDTCLIGMSATLLDNAVVNSGTIIAAGALVLSNQVCDGNSVYAGVPAKKVKTLTDEEVEKMILKNAHGYLMYKEWYNEEE